MGLLGPMGMPGQMMPRESGKITLGVYDSRGVALAYYHRVMANGGIEGLYEEHAAAEGAGDAERAKEVAAKALALQEEMHRRVFGTEAIDDIMAEIVEEAGRIAKEKGVDVVVSKWDIAYQGVDAESVDVTDELVALFEPSDKTLEAIRGLLEHEPVGREELEQMDHAKH